MTARILTDRHLNRALLDRQLLLERSRLSIEDALDQVAGLQTQYAPSGYVGLWTRLADFRRPALTAALEDRTAVQATLMRTTIHLVAARSFWRYALGVRQARRAWAARVAVLPPESELQARARALRQALGDGPRTVRELGPLGAGFIGNLGLWVDLVRVPPSGTWERRRADRLALAETWLGPENATEPEGLVHLVQAYLRAFGPAPLGDLASWAGLPVTVARAAAAELDLVRYRDDRGTELLDLAGLAIPDPDVPAPVRFLPHWDTTLLAHARRTGVLPEDLRARIFSTRNPFSLGVVLVDGRAVATWSYRDGIALEMHAAVAALDRERIEAERSSLEAFAA